MKESYSEIEIEGGGTQEREIIENWIYYDFEFYLDFVEGNQI